VNAMCTCLFPQPEAVPEPNGFGRYVVYLKFPKTQNLKPKFCII